MIEPTDLEAWFKSYGGFLQKYRRIAQRQGVDIFGVGSELVSMERYEAEWSHLIQETRRTYDGKLFYSANWDHLGDSAAWRQLDVLGVNAYYELAREGETPSLPDLRVKWEVFRSEIRRWARNLGKPIMFTEVGYPSRLNGLHDAWNHTRKAKPDLPTQVLGYQAFLEAWAGVEEVFGLFIYEWRGVGGEQDVGYTPRGKPALRILEKWMRSR